jgi:deazaflavin-dependent oxidoreductase (nitroreductase family)
MPLPRQVTLFNRAIANPVVRPFAGRVSPLALIEHRGRHSGRRYRTPVVGWFAGDEFIVPLTYGPDTDWVKNLRTDGGGRLIRGGRSYRVETPTISRGIARAPGIPRPIRRFLPLIRVDNYLRLRFFPDSGDTPND